MKALVRTAGTMPVIDRPYVEVFVLEGTILKGMEAVVEQDQTRRVKFHSPAIIKYTTGVLRDLPMFPLTWILEPIDFDPVSLEGLTLVTLT